jgi:H+/Cl- antiporter ClcA
MLFFKPSQLIRFYVAILLAGIATGVSVAFFIFALEWVTFEREAYPVLLWFLPFAGFFIGYLYHLYGAEVAPGNNLIIDEVHKPSRTIPLRMAPLVLFGTVTSHLFGASVGREGTAVQMGGSIFDQFSKYLDLTEQQRILLLMSGMSAGFGAMFGTPFAGAVFGIEVLTTKFQKIRLNAIIPCLLGSFIGNETVHALGAPHTEYGISFVPEISLMTVSQSMLAGIVFGITALLFIIGTENLLSVFRRTISYPPLRPFIGGLLVIVLTYGIGSKEYLGLGIPVIKSGFEETLSGFTFLLKMLFTSISLGSGFKGGEVTPLFFIGATLGNSLSLVLDLPLALLAGMGFVAVFGSAANTPIASIIMSAELFGVHATPYISIACITAFFISGQFSIYQSQKRSDRNNLKSTINQFIHSRLQKK